MSAAFDLTFIGHYTRDSISQAGQTKIVHGGACLYGASVAARLGPKAAVITRLNEQDRPVFDEIEELGVTVIVHTSPRSTELRLVYPEDDLDQRFLYISAQADPFNVSQVSSVDTSWAVLGASLRGEIPIDVVVSLADRGVRIALDVQGFIRVRQDDRVVNDFWPQRDDILDRVTILKTDSEEAAFLTGETDLEIAARRLQQLGPSEILITHGQGLQLLTGGRFFHWDFLPRSLRGRSGRGDTCLAAYTARRLDSEPEYAGLWAAAVTSLKLEAEGPFQGSLGDVETFIQKHYKPTGQK